MIRRRDSAYNSWRRQRGVSAALELIFNQREKTARIGLKITELPFDWLQLRRQSVMEFAVIADL